VIVSSIKVAEEALLYPLVLSGVAFGSYKNLVFQSLEVAVLLIPQTSSSVVVADAIFHHQVTEKLSL
jgi:hypothetical protein